MNTSLRSLLLALCGTLLGGSPLLAQEPQPAAHPARKPAQRVDPWVDKENVAKGRAMLESLYAQAGGLEKWQALEGLRFDLLETFRVMTNRKKATMEVHHYTSRLCWLQTNGDGFVRSEYVSPKDYSPFYVRETSVGNYAWSEDGVKFNRKPYAAAKARTRVGRLHFLVGMPFSIHERGGRAVFLKDLGQDKALYGLRLERPLVMSVEEEVQEFVLVVDTKTKRLLQLQYALVGPDKETLDKSTECYVDFEGALEVAGVTLAHKHTWFFELGLRTEEYDIEDPENVALPAESLRRPWLAGELWKTDLRADHWDPPKSEDPSGN